MWRVDYDPNSLFWPWRLTLLPIDYNCGGSTTVTLPVGVITVVPNVFRV